MSSITQQPLQFNRDTSNPVFSEWMDWNPRSYLETYFEFPKGDAIENIIFLHREIRDIAAEREIDALLDFGCGPTVFTGLVAAPYIKHFHCCDYLHSNLQEVKKWFEFSKDAFNWNNSVSKILELEGVDATEQNIMNRHQLLRKIPYKIDFADVSKKFPLGSRKKFPVVVSNFCTDSATHDKYQWQEYMKNVSSLLAEDGILLLAALRKCKIYRNGSHYFPSANIDEVDILQMLSVNNFDMNKTFIEIVNVPECKHDGFESIIFVRSQIMSKKSIIQKVKHQSSMRRIIQFSNMN